MRMSPSQQKKHNRKKQVKKAANIRKSGPSLIKGWKVKDAEEPIVLKAINKGKAYREVPIEEIDEVAQKLGVTRENLIKRVL